MFRVSFYKLVIPRFISVTPNKIWGIGCDTLQARTQKSMENWACGKPNLGAPKKSLTAGVDHMDGYTTMHLLIWGPGAHFWSPMGHFLAQLCQLGVSSWIYAGFIHQMHTERINVELGSPGHDSNRMEEYLETPTCSWEKVSKLDQRSSIVLLGR